MNIAQNRPDNFLSCPPDNHHCANDVYSREGGCSIDQTSYDNSRKLINCCILTTIRPIATNFGTVMQISPLNAINC